ncbi:MAG: hypothetical protein ACYCVL_03025 [Gemmatimonadaceae bacterium]
MEKRRMLPRVRIFVLTLSGMAVVLAAGCRDLTPPASSPASHAAAAARGIRNDVESSDGDDGGTPALLTCSAHGTLTTSAMVGSSGAVIAVGLDRLVIPAGAVAEPTLITATIPADTLADIHFGPQGLRFEKGATLVLSTAGCNLRGKTPGHVVYLDDAGNVLETLGATFNGHAVVTTIEHFSSYSIAF